MSVKIEKATRLLDPLTTTMKAAIALLLPCHDAIAAALAAVKQPPPSLAPGAAWWEG